MNEHLLDNIEDEMVLLQGDFIVSHEWLEEIRQRIVEIDAGHMEMIPAAQVFASICRELRH